MKTPKTQVSISGIESQFGDQINFLRKSTKSDDAGDSSEYKRLATTLRVIFYDSKSSISLVKQLSLNSIQLPSYARANSRNIVSETGLVIQRISGKGHEFLPALDFSPNLLRHLSFSEWWTESVFRDDQDVHFSRADFIRIVANQDGGAHVDGEIATKYHRLLNDGSIGWIAYGPNGEVPLRRMERAYLRHIAFEALLALEPEYLRLIGNRGCACHSGRKARYCCLKGKAFEDVYAFLEL